MKRGSTFILFLLFSAGGIMAQANHTPASADTVKPLKGNSLNNKTAYTQGLESFSKKDYATALKNFNEVLSETPSFEPAYLWRADTYLRQKNYGLAANDYKTAIKLDSNDERAWYGLGMAAFIPGHDTEAITAFQHFVKDDSDNGDAWYCLGESEARNGNYKEALQDFTSAIGNKTNFAEAYNDLGICHYELGNYSAAANDYQQSITIAKTPQTYYNLGNAENKSGNNEEAIKAFSDVIALNPGYTDAYNNRGIAYLDEKNDTNALADFNKAVQLDSTNVYAYCNRALAEYRMNELEKAKADYDKAVLLNPGYGIAYLNRGILEELMRHDQDACTDWCIAAQYGIVKANDYAKDCK